MSQEAATTASQRNPRTMRIDLVVTVVLFVLMALAAGAAFLVQWLIAAVSQYGCGRPTSTRACNTAVEWVPSLIEGIVLLAVLIGGAVAAGRARRDGPRGWVAACVTLIALVVVVIITSAVVTEIAT
jgi:Kef-type K+ transport system membrane component KefB